MIVIYVAVIIVFLLLIFLSKGRMRVKEQNIVDRIAVYIFERIKLEKIFCTKEVVKNLNILNPEIAGRKQKEKEFIRQFYIKKISTLILILLVGDVLALCLFICGRMESKLSKGGYISRNTYGLGSLEADLQAQIQKGERESRQNFKIIVGEQMYEEILIRKLAKEAAVILPELILGSNTSLEEVRSNLNLVQEIEDYPFVISWESDNYSILYSDGTVINEELKEEGEVVSLTAVLFYDNYKEEHIFPVHILPPVYTEEEQLKKKIYDLLAGQEEKHRYDKQIKLPENVDGAALVWKENREDRSGPLFLLAGGVAMLVFLLQDKELKEKVEARNRQMMLDYPQLVGKLTLYMGAGMTIRNAFKKIAFNYKKEQQETGKYHYVYEEMLLICHELEGGISEASAYEHFGKRCRMPQYTKLANLLIQNLKKGSSSITEALRQEAGNAFEERKNIAKKLGEEAGTKLLLPMMIMLGIVMMLIIVPAYFSFSV